jgi:hypothetical protein
MPHTVVVVLTASLFIGAASSGGQTDLRELTREQEKAVSGAAEKALKARDLWQGKIYLTNTEVVFDHQANPPERYALLTFYRYDGDLAILATVRLEKLAVTNVAAHPHMPTSLAPQEIAEAEKIARAHPDIQKALARYKHLDKIEIDTIVAQIISPEVPGYQHRVARLFFRDGQRNYLANVPMVDVDLTTTEVRFDLIRALHDKK